MMTTILLMLWAFFSGIFIGELLTLRQKRKWPRRPSRLSTNYWVGDDGRIYQVRCQPGRFERLCSRIEDESYQEKP